MRTTRHAVIINHSHEVISFIITIGIATQYPVYPFYFYHRHHHDLNPAYSFVSAHCSEIQQFEPFENELFHRIPPKSYLIANAHGNRTRLHPNKVADLLCLLAHTILTETPVWCINGEAIILPFNAAILLGWDSRESRMRKKQLNSQLCTTGI